MRTAAFAALAVLLLAAAPPALALHGPYDELLCLSNEGFYSLCLYAWDGALFQTCWGADVRVAGVTHQETVCAPFFHPCEFGCPIKIEDLPLP